MGVGIGVGLGGSWEGAISGRRADDNVGADGDRWDEAGNLRSDTDLDHAGLFCRLILQANTRPMDLAGNFRVYTAPGLDHSHHAVPSRTTHPIWREPRRLPLLHTR